MSLLTKAFHYPIGSNRKEPLQANVSSPLSTRSLVDSNDADAEFFRSLEENGIHLNEQQLASVRSIHGPHLILAGAGSGKTRVLTARTTYILTYDHTVKPEEVLLVTFTKKAAKEMKDRMKQMPLLSEDTVERIVSGTFHSIFLKFLRERGYNQKILASDKYRHVIMKRILRDLKLDDLYQPETVYAAISHWKNELVDIDGLEAANRTESELLKLYHAYEQWKRENEYIDFDDILVEMHANIMNDEAFRTKLQETFKYFCLDEYQDANLLQHEIVRNMTSEEANVIFVGDEDQLVYSWRNSSPKFILGLKEDYPTLKQILLTDNYRSTKSIIGAANQVISFNSSRVGKVCNAVKDTDSPIAYIRPDDSEQEAKWLIDHIEEMCRGGDRCYEDFTVLYRTHNYSRAMIDELAYRKIPFVIYGAEQLFYDSGVIRPLVSHLRLLVTEDDIDAIADIAPTCFVKREDAYNNAIDFATFEPDKPVLNSLLRLHMTSYQKSHIVNRISLLKLAKGKTPLEALRLFRKSFYDAFYETRERDIVTMKKEYIQEALNELEASAQRFNTVQEFIQFIDDITTSYENMNILREEEKPEAVKLMTIHQSKGLEFPVTFLIGASDNILPHASAFRADTHLDRAEDVKSEDAIEEERRLLYVGMTRAEEELFISSPKRIHDKEADVCRFLLEAYA